MLTGLTGAEVRTFEYDDVGRMTSEDRTQATALVAARDSDEIFSDGFETGDTRYWANGSGSTGYFEYTFNAADQLTGVLNGPNIAGSYSYDGDGLRVAVDDGQGGMLYYLRGPDGNTLAEYDDMGSLVAEYLYAGGRQIGKVVPDGSGGDEVSFFHSDHLGSALVITDDAGSVTWTGDYYPFGEPFSSSGTPDRYRFTQHELDTATSLFYAKARYYHPHIGRFLSVDPKGGSPSDPRTWNGYDWVAHNPLTRIDPSGMEWKFHSASQDDVNNILGQLSEKSGLELATDDGMVEIVGTRTDERGRPLGSGVARSLVKEAVSSEKTYRTRIVRGDPNVAGGEVSGLLQSMKIDMADIESVEYSGSVSVGTFDAAMVVLHELFHQVRGLADPSWLDADSGPQTGDVVFGMNLIRSHLGLSRRTNYFPTVSGDFYEYEFEGGSVAFTNY